MVGVVSVATEADREDERTARSGAGGHQSGAGEPFDQRVGVAHVVVAGRTVGDGRGGCWRGRCVGGHIGDDGASESVVDAQCGEQELAEATQDACEEEADGEANGQTFDCVFGF